MAYQRRRDKQENCHSRALPFAFKIGYKETSHDFWSIPGTERGLTTYDSTFAFMLSGGGTCGDLRLRPKGAGSGRGSRDQNHEKPADRFESRRRERKTPIRRKLRDVSRGLGQGRWSGG